MVNHIARNSTIGDSDKSRNKPFGHKTIARTLEFQIRAVVL